LVVGVGVAVVKGMNHRIVWQWFVVCIFCNLQGWSKVYLEGSSVGFGVSPAVAGTEFWVLTRGGMV